MAVITEILGTDSFSGSRLTINANFTSLNSDLDTIVTIFGLSLSAGNIDVSAASGGSIIGIAGAFNTLVLPNTGTATIDMDGSDGSLALSTLVAATDVQTPLLTVSLSGAISNGGTLTNAGVATFNGLVTLNAGEVRKLVDIGTTTTHTVVNADTVLTAASTSSLTLTADASLVNGHTFTIVKYGAAAMTLNTTAIAGGYSSITFSTTPYRSSITLHWNSVLAKFIVLNSVNVTYA